MSILGRRAQVLPLVVLLLVVGPALGVASADEGAVRLTYGRLVEATAGPLSGRVIYPDGATPAAEVAVRVWSIEHKKFVLQVTTDEKGAYSLKKLDEGHYLVVFGDRATVEVKVVKDAKQGVKTLDVIIPHGTGVFAQVVQERRAAVLTLLGEPEDEEDTDDRGLLKTVIIGAGATPTAVGIVAVVFRDSGSHHEDRKCVSP